MKVNSLLQRLMLDQVSIVLLASPNKLIKFFDKDDNLLANIPYVAIDSAYYFHQSSDPSNFILSAAASLSGVAAKFSIDGKDGMTLIPNAIQGTVGNYTSNADIKFNNTTWVAYSLVKLNRLYFFIR